MGRYDREEAVENEAIDFFASGHPLVEGIFAHYEDGPLGRAVRFQMAIGPDSGEGLVAIYKDGPAFEVVAIDADGNPRLDWAEAICQRPIRAFPILGKAAEDHEWRGMVRRLGAQLDATRRLHAVAAIVVRPHAVTTSSR